MRVAICTRDRAGYVGGPNVWLVRLLPYLVAHGVDPLLIFITVGDPEQAPNYRLLKDQGYDCRVLPDGDFAEHQIQWILRQVAASNIDIFLISVGTIPYYAARWIKAAGIPTIGFIQSDDPIFWGLVHEFGGKLPQYQLSAMSAMSAYIANRIRREVPDSVEVRQIPCGIPVPDQQATQPVDTLRMVYIGRLAEEQKRISDLTRAFCRAVREVPGVEGVLYGDGPDRSAVEAILRTEGKGLPVYLAGRIDSEQVYPVLLNHHVDVLLSDYEGWGLSVAEGMACGLVPIVLDMRSGIVELLENGRNGFVVTDRADSFVAAVRRLKEEPDLWAGMAQQARETIIQACSLEQEARRWMELFCDLQARVATRKLLAVPAVAQIHLPKPHPDIAEQVRPRPTMSQWARQRLRFLFGRLRRRAWHSLVDTIQRS